MNAFYYYEKNDGQTIQCKRISQIRIKRMWKSLTKKPMPEIIGIYVSNQKFETIYNDLYYNSPQKIRNRIDRGIRKEWMLKGPLSMTSGFHAQEINSERHLIVIRNKDYMIKEQADKTLEHELLHIVDNSHIILKKQKQP